MAISCMITSQIVMVKKSGMPLSNIFIQSVTQLSSYKHMVSAVHADLGRTDAYNDACIYINFTSVSYDKTAVAVSFRACQFFSQGFPEQQSANAFQKNSIWHSNAFRFVVVQSQT